MKKFGNKRKSVFNRYESKILFQEQQSFTEWNHFAQVVVQVEVPYW